MIKTLKVRFKKEEHLDLIVLRDARSVTWPWFGPPRVEIVRNDGGKLVYPAHSVVGVEEV